MKNHHSKSLDALSRSPTPSPPGVGIRVIVVETGASGFDGHVEPDEREETVLLSQAPGELSVEFAFRIMGRLAALEGSGKWIRDATVLLRPDPDELSLAAIGLVARTIVRHMAPAQGGELVLIAGLGRSAARSRVLGLTEALLLEPESRFVPIRICFMAPEERTQSAQLLRPKHSAAKALQFAPRTMAPAAR